MKMKMQTMVLMAVGLGGASQAHADDPQPTVEFTEAPGGTIEEIDAEAVTIRDVVGAPQRKIRGTRRSDAGRDLSYFDGTSWIPFLDGEMPLDMYAETVGDGVDLVCAQVPDAFPLFEEVLMECAVATGGAIVDPIAFPGAPHSFLRGICPTDGAFEVLVMGAENPIGIPEGGFDPQGEPPGCAAYEWHLGTGWVEAGQGRSCMCEQRVGEPCEHPCYDGPAHWTDEACEPDDDAAFLCDDGDPFTIDECTAQTSRCTPEHLDYGNTATVHFRQYDPVADAFIDVEEEVLCDPGKEGCHCTCAPGTEHCEVVPPGPEREALMCRHIDIEPTVAFVRGDANGDGAVNLTDGVFILNYLFTSGPEPACQDAADVNDDGQLNITDGTYVLNWLFQNGPAPVGYTGACGMDETPSALTCGASTGTCCEVTTGGCDG